MKDKKKIHIVIFKLRHGTPFSVYRMIRKCGRSANVLIIDDEEKLKRALDLIQRYRSVEYFL